MKQKFNILVAKIIGMKFFFSKPDSSDCLFLLSPNKNWKMMKLNFSIGMNIWKTQRTSDLKAKNYGGQKLYFTNKFERTINITCELHFSYPSCNSTLTPKKYAIKL